MKHKFWAIIIAILILSPSIVAVANYFSTKDSPINESSVSELTMTDLYGEEYAFIKSSEEFDLSNISTNMVQFFAKVNTTASGPLELPEPLKGTPYYKVNFNNYGRDIEYKYYFTDKAEYCYYTDGDDICYQINADYAAAFLTSLYGRSVFATATLPIMTTPSGDIIAPTDMKWTYLAINEISPTYTATDQSAATDTVYNIAESLGVSFSIPASSVEITVTRNAEELYSGLYDNLAYADLPTNETLDVALKAKWYTTDDRASEGEASYSFKCQITDKPLFTVSTNSTTIIPGDFVTVSAKNVTSGAQGITLTSSPDIGYTPVFYEDGNYMRALIPVPTNAAAGTYTLTFTADGVEQDVAFTVTAKSYSGKTESINSTALTEESLAAFDSALKSILTAKSTQKYFDGEFIYPVTDSVVSSGFGRTLTTASGYTYINNWVRVTSSTGSNVLAMNKGVVVYVGEQTMTGGTVIVDHGFGLMSIYANMTSTSVSVGDIVSTGDTLGISGASGYSDGSTVSVALTINGVYVSPYEIWDSAGVIISD